MSRDKKKIYNDFRSNISNIGADTFSKIERESPITWKKKIEPLYETAVKIPRKINYIIDINEKSEDK